MPQKKRLDQLLVDIGLVPTRSKAQARIMAGEVTVDGNRIEKSGTMVSVEARIELKAVAPYVSRGGEKLAGALHDFEFPVSGKTCADVGASTGGFTDCLLQHGARRIYAIDVGYGQIAHKLRIDPAVVVMERTNARYLEKLDEAIDLVVIDASFISLDLLLPGIRSWLNTPADVIALIKPQFEVGREDVGKGGVVRSKELHRQVLLKIIHTAQDLQYAVRGLTISPIKGLKEGNTEFLIWLGWQSEQLSDEQLLQIIDTLLAEEL
jgi:23S rRNA (cytidine1920-2'-O)/16S rRNA (cytidine1409-2'-O)-methyltransferase